MKTAKATAFFALHALVYLTLGYRALVTQPFVAVLFAGLLIWASMHDIRTFEIPDLASFLLVATGLILSLTHPKTLLADHIAGGVLWPLMFWVVASGYFRVRGAHGLGFGDVKLIAGIGVWCGFIGTIWVVLAAAIGGLTVLCILAFLHRRQLADIGQSAVAFGPFLCLCAWGQWATGAV